MGAAGAPPPVCFPESLQLGESGLAFMLRDVVASLQGSVDGEMRRIRGKPAPGPLALVCGNIRGWIRGIESLSQWIVAGYVP